MNSIKIGSNGKFWFSIRRILKYLSFDAALYNCYSRNYINCLNELIYDLTIYQLARLESGALRFLKEIKFVTCLWMNTLNYNYLYRVIQIRWQTWQLWIVHDETRKKIALKVLCIILGEAPLYHNGISKTVLLQRYLWHNFVHLSHRHLFRVVGSRKQMWITLCYHIRRKHISNGLQSIDSTTNN